MWVVKKQPSNVRPTLFDINESTYYSIVVRANKCSGNCNTIDVPYTQIYVWD